MRFIDRRDAGRQLAYKLANFESVNTIVLALPRGGIILGKEVAKTLNAPLGLVLVRKIGHPYNAEYAIGALAEDEMPVYNEAEIAAIDASWLKKAEMAAHELIEKCRQVYYGNDFTPPNAKGKTVILVDDGIATGLTIQAAVKALKQKKPKKVIVAIPVAPRDSVAKLKQLADEVILLDDPDNFLGAVGAHYQNFPQVNDEEVKSILREARDDLHQEVSTVTPTAKSRPELFVSGHAR